MSRVLWRPRWLVGHVLVVAVCVLFVNLGFWQIRRLEERRLENIVMASRLAADPQPIEELIVGAGRDLDSLEFRGTTATGEFAPNEEVLVRSQVHEGTAGWHVITPMVLADGRAVLVNRGWVPLEMDEVPVRADPPAGEVTISGWLGLTRTRQSGGATEPDGRLTQIARVDIDRLQQQMPFELLPVYISADQTEVSLPIAVSRPITSDEGPHLLYAIEWFSFTLISVVGYGFLLRRAVHRSGVGNRGSGLGQSIDHSDIAERGQ
jgi:surfeit locus 1 family protein